MNPTKHATRWMEIAKLPIPQVKEHILTNYESRGWEASTSPLLNLIKVWTGLNPGNSILDFGCGLGRNLIPLAAAGYFAHGFDTETMIKAATPIVNSSGHKINLYDDFQSIYQLSNTSKPFDLIIVSLVAQHMHPDDLKEAFSQFSKIGNKLLVAGRDWNDFISRDQRPLATWELIDEALGDSMLLVCEKHNSNNHGAKLWSVIT